MQGRKQMTDQIVSAEDVRLVMQRLSGTGWRHALKELERMEPSLAAYISTAGNAAKMSLHGVGYSNAQAHEFEQYFLHSLVVIHVLTRIAHRRLLDDFLPADDKLLGSVEGKGETA